MWTFDTAAVLRWMTGDDLDERMKEARSRLREAKAGLRWLEYGRKPGYTHHIEDLLPPIVEAAQVLKFRMLAMPGRLDHLLASESDPAVIERIVTDEVDDMLRQLDRQIEEFRLSHTVE